MTTKTCTKCGIEKDISEFHKYQRLEHGVNTVCIDCASKLAKGYYEQNKEIIKQKVKDRYYAEVREAKLAKTAAKKAELDAHRKALQEQGIKICTKCGETKPVEDFSIKSKAYDGRNPSCRECEGKKRASYYAEHREEAIARTKEYYEEHKEELRAKEKIRRQDPEARQRKLEADRAYYNSIKDTPEHKEKAKVYRQSVPKELKKSYQAKYVANNKEKLKEKDRLYRIRKGRKFFADKRRRNIANNKEHYRAYAQHRRETNPKYAMRIRCSHRIREALKRFDVKKESPVSEIVGCTLTELVAHLLSTMPPNSTEADLLSSEYHIDHLVPIACAKSPEEVLKLNHYTNLRMLPATENLLKRDKIISEAIELHATLLSRPLTTDPLFNLMVEATEENKEAFERLK